MKVSEAIKLLESKVVKSEENLKHFPKESQGYAANEARIIAYNIAITKLEQIDEPQAEKVEVPDFVAEWYESHKDDLEDAISGQIDHGHDIVLDTRKAFDVWFFDESDCPIETLIRMKDGYTVKPKRWVVRQGGSEVWYLQGFRNSLDGDIVKQWCSHEGCIKFTDRAKAEAVATLVEGSVEEA